ncbi:hypothetical protein EDD18DRAFT_552405 [Armillaria luteobubalina]|uniref:Uncharacterized protein n=1 Tax=Armillaria luteobubalina TaxID=153913 RepID=A0AA39UN97_9AGAR|nr:hypothetical protein EDD18DRAFT_552405 [Armillaria luteobubalina]
MIFSVVKAPSVWIVLLQSKVIIAVCFQSCFLRQSRVKLMKRYIQLITRLTSFTYGDEYVLRRSTHVYRRSGVFVHDAS